MRKRSLTLILALTCAGTALAQQGTSSLSFGSLQSKKKNPFHMTVDLSASTNLHKENSAGQAGSTDLDLIPSVDLTNRISLGARTIISQEQKASKQRDTRVSNTQINLKIKGHELSRNLSTAYLLRGVAPTSAEMRKDERYQGAAALAGTLIFIKGMITTKYTLLGNRNFHEFTTNADGDPNSQYTLTHDAGFDFEVTKNFVLSMGAYYKQGWTYKNSNRQTYGYSAGLGYSVTKQWSIGASVETNGRALKPNGTDSNINLYDQNTSVVRAGVTFTN